MGANIKSMTLEQARSYRDQLKSQGKSESTSKEYAKVADYINVLKDQAGKGTLGKEALSDAYKHLSRGVTTTGGWTEKNLDQIEAATGERPQLTSPSALSTSNDLSSYLGNYQDSVYGSAGSPELRESIAAQLEPDMAKPEPLNRVEEFEKMREEMGVADLENTLTDLKAQLENEYATKRARTNDALSKPVALGAISGRIGEIERQETDRIDALGRQINVINDQLTTSYNVISQYMNFMGLDYQDAVEAYNTEFNRNLQIYNLVDEELDERVASARSNLQIYQNAIIGGNMSYNDLSPDQRSFINKLEVQAGLPIGTTARLRPDEKVLYSGTRTVDGVKYYDSITQGANGQPITRSISLGSSGSDDDSTDGTGKETISTYSSLMIDAIKTAIKEAKDMGISYESGGEYITINQAKPLIDAWKKNTGKSSDDWWTRFGKYVFGGKQ